MTRRRILVLPPSWKVSVSSVRRVVADCEREEPEELSPETPVMPEEPDVSRRSPAVSPWPPLCS
jgi:hypothetical protein